MRRGNTAEVGCILRHPIRTTSTAIPFKQLRRILCYAARSVGPLLLLPRHPATSSNRPRTCATSGMQGRPLGLQGQIVSHQVEFAYKKHHFVKGFLIQFWILGGILQTAWREKVLQVRRVRLGARLVLKVRRSDILSKRGQMNERKKFAEVKEGEKCKGEKLACRCLCFVSHRMHTMRKGANLSRCAKTECHCD